MTKTIPAQLPVIPEKFDADIDTMPSVTWPLIMQAERKLEEMWINEVEKEKKIIREIRFEISQTIAWLRVSTASYENSYNILLGNFWKDIEGKSVQELLLIQQNFRETVNSLLKD